MRIHLDFLTDSNKKSWKYIDFLHFFYIFVYWWSFSLWIIFFLKSVSFFLLISISNNIINLLHLIFIIIYYLITFSTLIIQIEYHLRHFENSFRFFVETFKKIFLFESSFFVNLKKSKNNLFWFLLWNIFGNWIIIIKCRLLFYFSPFWNFFIKF